jgi:hypothetical protein
MLIKLAEGSDIDAGPVESILFHEVGHALARDSNSSLFRQLNPCLARMTNLNAFEREQQPTVHRESLADWFASQAMGAQLRLAPASQRALLVENRLGGEICGILHHKNQTCVNHDWNYFYPLNRISHLGEHNVPSECGKILRAYDHPLTPDRLQIMLSNGGIKSALGCSSTSRAETRGCSL